MPYFSACMSEPLRTLLEMLLGFHTIESWEVLSGIEVLAPHLLFLGLSWNSGQPCLIVWLYVSTLLLELSQF